MCALIRKSCHTHIPCSGLYLEVLPSLPAFFFTRHTVPSPQHNTTVMTSVSSHVADTLDSPTRGSQQVQAGLEGMSASSQQQGQGNTSQDSLQMLQVSNLLLEGLKSSGLSIPNS